MGVAVHCSCRATVCKRLTRDAKVIRDVRAKRAQELLFLKVLSWTLSWQVTRSSMNHGKGEAAEILFHVSSKVCHRENIVMIHFLSLQKDPFPCTCLAPANLGSSWLSSKYVPCAGQKTAYLSDRPVVKHPKCDHVTGVGGKLLEFWIGVISTSFWVIGTLKEPLSKQFVSQRLPVVFQNRCLCCHCRYWKDRMIVEFLLFWWVSSFPSYISWICIWTLLNYNYSISQWPK